MDEEQRTRIREDFAAAVNMTPKELEEWLATEQSQSVGDTGGEGESTGHRSGRRIVAVKHRKVADLSDEDYEHMRTVVGYVARHGQQRPAGDVTETKWRYSLMNWGHDPLK